MKYAVSIAGESVEVEILHEEGQTYALVEGQKIPVELVQHERGRHTLLFGNKSVSLWLSGHGTGYVIGWRGRSVSVELEPAHVRTLRERFRRGKDAQAVGVEEIRAFMPGLVVNVEVEPGQRVQSGDGLVVISAMKMENEIRAPCEGVVENVNVRAGQEVKKGQLLCVIRYEQGQK